MQNRYPLWKYLILIVALVAGVLYALPNVYGEDPAVQIAKRSGGVPAETVQQRIVDLLKQKDLRVKSTEVTNGHFLVRMYNTTDQLEASDEIELALGGDYTVALNLAPSTPDWLRAINAKPMFLGLDLRGGVHFLMNVDLQAALEQTMERYTNEFRTQLRDERIRYQSIDHKDAHVEVAFDRAAVREHAFDALQNQYPDLTFSAEERDGKFWLVAKLPDKQVRKVQDFAVSQNITTLRNRVNELGVAEPLIQRQGRSRIVVQLPGVQDTARAKDILGATATLEFHKVDESNFPYQGGPDATPPPGSKVYKKKDGGYVLLKKQVILTGEYITDAQSGLDKRTGQPQVLIHLNDAGGDIFSKFTTKNVGKYMAVVFIENQSDTKRVNGKVKKVTKEVQQVINVARIQEPLGSRFQITGLDNPREARNLALLLRAGSLAAPMQIVQERTIGPSLGQENIDEGFNAVIVGFVLVVGFMILYYKVFGVIADLALLANLVLIVGLLSILQATLTLPGIAGIVLTVGMAVDANVLIFERIREELRNGASPQTAIGSGYDKAFSTIADANITTLIAAIVLFAFGTGPIKGFAVTLSIGIVTSMFTAILGTRAVVNLIYGGRRKPRLLI